MQTVETLNQGLKRAYRITISKKDIDARVDGELKKVAPQIRMPGCRPGKVPANLVRKMHGAAIEQELEHRRQGRLQQRSRSRIAAREPQVELEEGGPERSGVKVSSRPCRKCGPKIEELSSSGSVEPSAKGGRRQRPAVEGQRASRPLAIGGRDGDLVSSTMRKRRTASRRRRQGRESMRVELARADQSRLREQLMRAKAMSQRTLNALPQNIRSLSKARGGLESHRPRAPEAQGDPDGTMPSPVGGLEGIAAASDEGPGRTGAWRSDPGTI